MSLNASLGAAMIHSALLILMGVLLTLRVIGQRRGAGVGIGDGGDARLARAIRAHGNFAENAPFAIGSYTLLGLAGASAWLIHVLGIVFLVGRVAHAAGLSQHEGASVGRFIGMVLAGVVLCVAAVTLLIHALA
jgi:uncharacterized membrane protein YecN with MAPEG domain